MPAPRTPERWSIKAGDASAATLNIPPDVLRERRFEISCAMTVGVPDDARKPWHQMTVQANGAQQWKRRVDSANPGEYDGLELRFARTVPVGEALRISVTLAGSGVRRRSLDIEADEQL